MSIASGETISASIDDVHEVDDYTFDAVAGETVIVGAAEASASPLTLRIQLIAPNSTSLMNLTGAIGNGGIKTDLSATGTYTIRISDSTLTNTGDYNVSMAKAGPQVSGDDDRAIISGEYVSATIDAGDIDVFTIEAVAGSKMLFTAAELLGQPLDFSVQVLGPTGQLFIDRGGAVSAYIAFELPAVPLTGTYYVMVWDVGFDATGTYNMTVVSSAGPHVSDSDSGELTSGVTRTGTLDAGDFDVYTIWVPDNGVMTYGFAATSSASSYTPSSTLIYPTGQQHDFFQVITAAYEGYYTIVIYDQNCDATGSYAITAVSAPMTQPVDEDSGRLISGENRNGSATQGDLDVYTIELPEEGALVGMLSKFSTSPGSLSLIVVGPYGQLLMNSTSPIAILPTFEGLPQGIYTAIVAGLNYSITLTASPGVQFVDADSVPLTNGVRRTGHLDLGDMDVYTIDAPANSEIWIALGKVVATTGELRMVIMSPDGAIEHDRWSSSTRQFEGVWAQHAGTYVIAVSERGGRYVMDYALTAVVLPMADTTNLNAEVVNTGDSRAAQIGPGEMHAYAIDAVAGGSLLIKTARLIPNIDTSGFFVLTPGGRILENFDGFSAHNLAETGRYIFLFHDSNNAPSSYAATFGSIGTSIPNNDVDAGPIASGVMRGGSLPPADMDFYTIDLSAGSSILISLANQNSSQAHVLFMFFSPSGKRIQNSIFSQYRTELYANVIESGTFTLVVYEYLTLGLDYNLTVVRSTGPHPTDTDSGPFAGAEYRRGDIDPAEIDLFTIQGTEGHNLLISLSESEYLGTANGCEPGIAVFTPTGGLLHHSSFNVGTTLLLNATTTGTYTIAIYEFNADEPMAYALSAMSFSSMPALTGDSGPITSGVTRHGRIDRGDIDVFTMNILGDQDLFFTLSDASGSAMGLAYWVIAPDGTVADSSGGSSSISRSIWNSITTSGLYKIVITHYSGGGAGDYAFTASLSDAPPPDSIDSGPIVSGTPRSGSISVGDNDVYTFTTANSPEFMIHLAETNPAGFDPRVVVYGDTGDEHPDATFDASGTLTVAGSINQTYTIIVCDDDADETSGYSISIDSSTGSDNLAPHFYAADYRFDAVKPELTFFVTENLGESLTLEDVVLTNLSTATVVNNSTLAMTYSTTTGRIVIKSSASNGNFADGNYRLTINAGDVSDLSGNPLAANYDFDFFVLAGDVNRDRVVNFNDLLALSQNYGRIGRSFSQGNFNYSNNGEVEFNDLLTVAQRYGSSIPQPITGSFQHSGFFTQSRRPIGHQFEMLQ